MTGFRLRFGFGYYWALVLSDRYLGKFPLGVAVFVPLYTSTTREKGLSSSRRDYDNGNIMITVVARAAVDESLCADSWQLTNGYPTVAYIATVFSVGPDDLTNGHPAVADIAVVVPVDPIVQCFGNLRQKTQEKNLHFQWISFQT